MPGSSNMTIRIDPQLKSQAEDVLSQLGMNMTGAINMFLTQIVRDRAVPLSLSLDDRTPCFLSTRATLHDDLLVAKQARENGDPGIPAETLIAEMKRIVAEAG